MSNIAKKEKVTQQRVVHLLREQLEWKYLGDFHKRESNQNVEPELFRSYLTKQGYDASLVDRALHQLEKEAGKKSTRLYERNKAVYQLLRYGVKVRPDIGENKETVWLIDWANPQNNDFAFAEEVAVTPANLKGRGKRPDIVLYINGIALGVIELKRSCVSVSEGIRQNLDNQKRDFIEHFFSTIQLLMAGNDTEGLRYGTIETREKYYLTWKEESTVDNLLERHLLQLCNKERFLEIIHDFVVYDSGVKKLCRHNQYFGVRAAQESVRKREGGIIWHTQGSGKSLTMVWLTKWLRENAKDARVLIITDRDELDKQIEKVFAGVNESIYRTKSGADLVAKLNETNPWLLCSLIHKFGGKGQDDEADVSSYTQEIQKALPSNFEAKGNLFVFVDECHRTQSDKLHKAMKALLPNALFIGFTGTPLLKADKKKSVEIFGPYIHTYKFNEAIEDKVVLPLRFEARDIDQDLTSPEKVDQWFSIKTSGLNDLAKAQLKKRWGTLRKVLSSRSRLEKIVDDILLDMELRDRLKSGRGNAMLVCDCIFSACKFYELFDKTDLKGKCAIITSYKPSPNDIKGEESGEGMTEKLRQYEIYRRMLGDWFNEPLEDAASKPEQFEKEVKETFINEPGQMKLLIVVDKLLTGFDAPPATYLYIDKSMQDHGLFQAVCRVNRLDDDDKEYGYIIDYKDLFKNYTRSVQDYTGDALDGYDSEDVAGLLEDRLTKAKERLAETREAIKMLCEPVSAPKNERDYIHYFCGQDSGSADQLKDNEPRRLSLYKLTAAFVRAYANIANEFAEAGFSLPEIEELKEEVFHFEKVREVIKLASGDYIDLKLYEPAMRHLIDCYIRAEASEKISDFDETSLVKLFASQGSDALDGLPKGIRNNKEAVAETIENNVRKLIIDEHPINPKYYEKMSELLDALIEQRKHQAMEYKEYLRGIKALCEKVCDPSKGSSYPSAIDTPGKQALYDNLGENEGLVREVDYTIRRSTQDGWRNNRLKEKRVRYSVEKVLDDEAATDQIMEIIKEQTEY
jgi:type I restriction enzyme, R subunit